MNSQCLHNLQAQAQECLLEKSLIDHRKNTVIAKLAVHLRDLYKQCREHLDASALSDVIPSSRYKVSDFSLSRVSHVGLGLWRNCKNRTNQNSAKYKLMLLMSWSLLVYILAVLRS